MNRLALAGLLLATPAVGVGYSFSRQTPPPAYITAPVARGEITNMVRASGSVEAVTSVDVSSQLSGRIAEVFVNFNDRVSAGQPLARLDQKYFVARVNGARAALKVASANLLLEQAALRRETTAVDNARTARAVADAQLAAEQARQDEAEREFTRQMDLARTGVVSKRDMDHARTVRDSGAAMLRAAAQQVESKSQAIAMAEAQVQMAEAKVQIAEAVTRQQQASLEQAEIDLARTIIRAPVDGIVLKRAVNPGQTVAVGLDVKTLFTIAGDLRAMVVYGKIDEADVGQVKSGQTVRFTVDAYPGRTFIGRVQQVRKAPDVVQGVVVYTAIISAPNDDLLLFPGMTSLLRIVVRDTGTTLVIPNEALRFHPSGVSNSTASGAMDAANAGTDAVATVWGLDQSGHPAPITVTTGVGDDHYTEVRAGPVVENQTVIIGTAAADDRPGLWGIRLGF